MLELSAGITRKRLEMDEEKEDIRPVTKKYQQSQNIFDVTSSSSKINNDNYNEESDESYEKMES
jgi:hypothetical protein